MGKVVSAREFARFYRMDESTVRFYAKKGVLKPKLLDLKGFDLEDYHLIAEYRKNKKKP